MNEKNFIQKYMEFAEPLTECPRTFHHYMAYVILSTAVGRNAFYSGAGSFPISPNLWFIFVGPSSVTKKSTMLNIGIRHILNKVFDSNMKLQMDGSLEAFIESLVKKPYGIMVHSEFGSFMSWITRDYNRGMRELLSELYDQPEDVMRVVGTRTKREEMHIRNAFLNLVTVSTIEWMNSSLNVTDATGGFLQRFNMVIDRSAGNPIHQSPVPNQQLMNELIWELAKIKEIKFGELKYSPGALKMHKEFYDLSFSQSQILDPRLPSYFSRRMTDMEKFSMLNHIMRIHDHDPSDAVMTEEDLAPAIKICKQLREFTLDIILKRLALTPFQMSRNMILEIIDKICGSNGSYAHHWKVLKFSRMKKRDFQDIIDTLTDEQAILIQKDTTKGRPSTAYRINPEADND